MESATEVLHEFEPAYDDAVARGFAAKLGVDLGVAPQAEAVAQFRAFAETTFDLMEATGQDFTLFFRAVAEDRLDERVDPEALADWLASRDRLVEAWAADGAADTVMMQCSNPVYTPRNHHLERALSKAEDGDMSDFHRLLAAVQDPYVRHDQFAGLEGPGSESAFVTYCGT